MRRAQKGHTSERGVKLLTDFPLLLAFGGT